MKKLLIAAVVLLLASFVIAAPFAASAMQKPTMAMSKSSDNSALARTGGGMQRQHQS